MTTPTHKKTFACPWTGDQVEVSLPPAKSAAEFCPTCNFPMFWSFDVIDHLKDLEDPAQEGDVIDHLKDLEDRAKEVARNREQWSDQDKAIELAITKKTTKAIDKNAQARTRWARPDVPHIELPRSRFGRWDLPVILATILLAMTIVLIAVMVVRVVV